MSWNKTRSLPESLEILGTLSSVCDSLGGPVTNELYSLVEKGLYKEVLSYSWDLTTVDSDDCLYARQIQGFFQKLGDLNLGIDRAKVAADRFVESELKCLEVNRTFAYHRARPLKRPSSVDVVLHYAQRKISDTLGTVPSLDKFDFAFGPGANTNVKSAVAMPRAKLSADLGCSHSLLPVISEFLYETPMWASLHAIHEDETSFLVPVSRHHGKLQFVPKNAKTDRSIVVEPLLNSFFQKGVGSYIRNRLMRQGIDLTDQSRNQNLARRGSILNDLSTIDLSMASDTIATELVKELLPYDWFDLLQSLRTGSLLLPSNLTDYIRQGLGLQWDSVDSATNTVDPENVIRLEKFSSMGNGFTFELESLIFYALCYGVCRASHVSPKDVSVYGDDIIIPRKCTSLLLDVLQYCGFTVNPEKSYSDGRFRESCGADYLDGFDIRPFYQKTLISDRTLYTMHNWFIRHGERKLAAAVIPFCVHTPLLYGPDGYGDGHLLGDFTLRQSRKMKRDGWCGGFFDTYSLRSARYTRALKGDYVLPTYSVYTRSGAQSATDPDVVRGSRGYAKLSIYTLVESIFHDLS